MSFIKIMIMICQIEWIENEWWFFSWMIVTCIPYIHDMIFMQFFVFMKYLFHHPTNSSWYSLCDNMNAWNIHKFVMMHAILELFNYDVMYCIWCESWFKMLWVVAKMINVDLMFCIMNALNDDCLVPWSKYW